MRSTMMRLAAGLLAMLLLAACAGGDAAISVGGDDDGGANDGGGGNDGNGAPSAVTVGLINPLTGPYAALGEDVNAGFELYVEQQGGELSGYQVETLIEDTANDVAVATERIQQLVERDGSDVLFGLVSSAVAYGVSSYVRDSGVPLVITVAGADGLTQNDAVENIFRVSYTSSQDAMPLGDYACNDLGYSNVAVVGLDYAFGWEAAGGFSRVLEDAGCTVVQEIYAPLGTQDWAPFVQQINPNADAVWAVIAGADAIRFLRAYRDFGVTLPLIGHGSTTDEQILSEQADTADGVITTLHYSTAIDSDLNREFVAAFEEAYGRSASQYSEHGYAAAQVLEAALADGDPSQLAETIGGVEIEAPRGPLRFDEYGQAVYNVYVREVEQVDGEWQNTVIDTIPEVNQFWTYPAQEYLSFEPYEQLVGTWAGG